MKLTIHGAARQVTGSMHLLEVNGYKILVDCGLDYDRDRHLEDNANFPFNPETIDVVVLTHAHIDHSGNIPTLIRLGFDGQIICTAPTAELSELLLMDSVNIFLRKQEKAKKHRRKRHGGGGPQPLYLQKHVMDMMERIVSIRFNQPFKLNGDIELQFIPVGHLLGAAAVHFKVNDNGTEKTIAFTGDVGRYNYPVLQDPELIPQANYLVSESTYGGRFHTKEKTIDEVLMDTIQKACIAEHGRLIIPAFSIGRTQALVFSLNKIFSQGLLPPVKVFVDSPLAMAATEVFRRHHHLLNDEAKEFYSKQGDEFEFENLTYVEKLSHSREISNYFEPCIIVSSAGMLEGGRIQDHLFYNISNYYCTLLFIGYSAKGTLGHRLLRGDPIVKIRDRELAVYATIKQTDLFSGHADQEGLMNVIKQQDKSTLKKVFLVHGETQNMLEFSKAIQDEGYEVEMPEVGIGYEL